MTLLQMKGPDIIHDVYGYLLQTAKATVYRPGKPHRRMTARIILDGGSQRSYVTERIKKDSGQHGRHFFRSDLNFFFSLKT